MTTPNRGESSRDKTSHAPQSPNSSQQKRKNSLNNAMGAKKSKQNVMIPYKVKSKDMGDSDYRELRFECCIILGKAQVPSESKIPSEGVMTANVKRIRNPSTKILNSGIQATTVGEVFFYAEIKMPSRHNSYLAKRHFTTGLQKVDNNVEHIIKSTVENEDIRGMVVFYICKEEKKSQYENHVNKGHALITKLKIEDDFHKHNLENKPMTFSPGTIYFFYTASAAAFEIKHQSVIISSTVGPECIIVDSSPESRSLPTTRSTTPPIKHIKQELTSSFSPSIMTPPMPKDQSIIWDTTDGSLKTKKRKLGVENQIVVKEEKTRIAELEQELYEAKEEITTLKKAMKKHCENLVKIHEILKDQPNS